MKNQIATIQQRLDNLTKFCAQRTIPEDFFSILDNGASLAVFIDGSERKLAQLGEAVGTDGWECRPDGSWYSWFKTIDGIRILAWHVSRKPEEVKRPVDPKEFPLLLEQPIDIPTGESGCECEII